MELPAQHLLLKLPQRRRGVETEIVAQPVAVAHVGGQRLDGAPRPGQGRDQQLDRPLPPRLLRNEGVEGGRGLGDPVQVQQQGRPVFSCRQPELLKPKGFRACEPLGELGERQAAPQRQCLIQERHRGGGSLCSAGLGKKVGEARRIDRRPGDVHEVARWPGDDDVRGRAERLTQPGDIGLQRVAGLRRRGLAEHVIDQAIQRHHLPRPQQQRAQQRPLACPGHGDMPPIDPDLERPQDAELHLMRHVVTPLLLDGKATIAASRHRRGCLHSVNRVIGT